MEKSVQVTVRCRPLSENEKKSAKASVVQCKPISNEIIVRRKTYTFDKVFGQYATQQEVFECSVQGIIDEALNGYNCTVFAYGQTGTGKTHTIQGDLRAENVQSGIIPRSIYYIFAHLKNCQEYSVKVSFLQLYNEELQDLLDSTCEKKLRLMEDTKRGEMYCQHLQEVSVHSPDEVFGLLKTAVANRNTAETLLNANSSRSHCIFTVKIHVKETTPEGEDLVKIGKLHLVDLAGSECIGRSGAKSSRAREAGNINQSLLTLGRVITALVDKHPHIPYRDSKLTRLLQESLGGRAKTLIIATLSPCGEFVEETMSTLDYAHRAKSIKNKPEVNQRMTKRTLIKEYTLEVETLRTALQAARDKNGIYLDPTQFANMEDRLAGQEAQIGELEGIIEVRNQENKELEIKIKTVTSEYSQLYEQFNETTQTLEEKIKELEETKRQLCLNEKKLQETQFTLNCYEKNEKVLIHNGIHTIGLVEEYKNETSQLRDVIERKGNVEMKNSNLHDQYEKEFSQHYENLGLHQKKFQQQHHQHYQEMATSLVDSLQENIKMNEEMTHSIQELESVIKNKVGDLAEKTEEIKHSFQKHVEKVQENDHKHLESTGQLLDEFLEHLVKQSTRVIEILKKKKIETETTMTRMYSQLDQELQQGNAFGQNLVQQVLAIEQFVQQNVQQQNSHLTMENKEMETFLQQHIEKCKDESVVITQQIQDIMNHFMKQQENLLENCILKFSSTATGTSNVLNSISSQVSDQLQTVQKESKEFQSLLGQRYEGMKSSMKDNVENLQQQTDTAIEITEQTSRKSNLSKESIQNQLHNNSNLFLQQLDQEKQGFLSNLINNQSDILSIMDSSSKGATNLNALVLKSFHETEKTTNHLKNNLTNCNEETGHFVKDSENQVNQLNSLLKEYNAALQMDTPSGTTPLKPRQVHVPSFQPTKVIDENEFKKRRRENLKAEMSTSLITMRSRKQPRTVQSSPLNESTNTTPS